MQALYKPKAGLLQVDTGLEGQDEKNAKATTSEEEKPTSLKLQSSVASLPGVFAAAVVRYGLSPLVYSCCSDMCRLLPGLLSLRLRLKLRPRLFTPQPETGRAVDASTVVC